MPSSRTCTTTWSSPRWADRWMRPPSGVYLAALVRQVGKHLGQPGSRRPAPAAALPQRERQLMFAGVEHGMTRLDRTPHYLGQVEQFRVQRDLARA